MPSSSLLSSHWPCVAILYDHRGQAVRLTGERLAHGLEHPEMNGMESAIAETPASPENVTHSLSDEQARLYYSSYSDTLVVGYSRHTCN